MKLLLLFILFYLISTQNNNIISSKIATVYLILNITIYLGNISF